MPVIINQIVTILKNNGMQAAIEIGSVTSTLELSADGSDDELVRLHNILTTDIKRIMGVTKVDATLHPPTKTSLDFKLKSRGHASVLHYAILL